MDDDGYVPWAPQPARARIDRPATTPNPKSTAPALELTPIGDLLAEPDEAVEFIVEDLIAKASVNVLSSKPKVGKSTLARALAIAVARGEDFLGRRCPDVGTVWYFALEGSRNDIRKAFRKLGATDDDPLHLFIGKAPQPIITQVRELAVRDHPALIIIDTMQRFLRATDMNDYSEMTLLFDHVIQIAHTSKAALLLLTHNAKIQREGMDSILGSTAIAGSVDVAILLTRSERYRTISTVQRSGDDLGETILTMDDHGHVHLAGSRYLADQRQMREAILDVLEKAGSPLRQPELLDQVEGRRSAKWQALKELITTARDNPGNSGNRNLVVAGAGTKNSPFLYSLSCSRVPPIGGNTNPTLSFDQQSQTLSPENGCSGIRTGPEHESEHPSGGNDDLNWRDPEEEDT